MHTHIIKHRRPRFDWNIYKADMTLHIYSRWSTIMIETGCPPAEICRLHWLEIIWLSFTPIWDNEGEECGLKSRLLRLETRSSIVQIQVNLLLHRIQVLFCVASAIISKGNLEFQDAVPLSSYRGVLGGVQQVKSGVLTVHVWPMWSALKYISIYYSTEHVD